MKSAAFHNLGCKVNSYEMDFMQQALSESGYQIVPFEEKADIYIINTCTVTNIADRKSRQMLHRAKKNNPDAVVVAVGCYVQAEGEKALMDAGIDLAVGNNRKKDLPVILEEFLRTRKAGGNLPEEELSNKTLHGKTILDIAHTKEYEEMRLRRVPDHTRAFVKVQDGCNQFCSYCIIPYARGRIRSREQKDILEEVKSLTEEGCREVVLTGIHLSSYGLSAGDKLTESALLSMVEAVQRAEEGLRIRLGSLEPRIITPQFAKALSELPGICPHFHLSLQSGSNAVLKRMNRKYTTEEYYEKACILREHFQNPALTTDVIVGFPGETEEEFRQTKAFLDRVGFYEMHIFKYSKREGTPAAEMGGQVSKDVKALRSRELMLLEEEQSARFRESYLHKQAEVLFEEAKVIDGVKFQIGHTREYIRVAALSDRELSGQVRSGELTGFLKPDILQFYP